MCAASGDAKPIRQMRPIRDRAIQQRATRQQPTCSVPFALPHPYLYPSLLCLDLAAPGLLGGFLAGWLMLACAPLLLPLLDTLLVPLLLSLLCAGNDVLPELLGLLTSCGRTAGLASGRATVFGGAAYRCDMYQECCHAYAFCRGWC